MATAKPKAFRRVRRNAAGKLEVFFIDEQGNEIDPSLIGNYEFVSSDSPNLNDTVQPSTTSTSSVATGNNNTTYGSSSSSSSGSLGSSDNNSLRPTGTMDKNLLGDIFSNTRIGKLFGLLSSALGMTKEEAVDTPAANTAVRNAQKAIPVVGNVPNPNVQEAAFAANDLYSQVGAFMLEEGAAPAAVVALANTMEQVSGLNPEFTDGIRYGVLAWDGDRRSKLLDYATSLGQSPNSLEIQARFAVEEAKPDSPYANPGSVEAFQLLADNPNMSATDFSQVVMDKIVGRTETPTVATADAPIDISVPDAEEVQPMSWVPTTVSPGGIKNMPPPEESSVFSPPTQTIVPTVEEPTSGFVPYRPSQDIPTQYDPQVGDTRLTDNGGTETLTNTGWAPDQAQSPNTKVNTELVRPDGTSRPAITRDENAIVPRDFRPSIMDDMSPGEIKTDKFGLPAPTGLDVDIARDNIAPKTNNPFGMPFAPQTEWIPTLNPEGEVKNSNIPFGVLAPGPNMQSKNNLGTGQSWVPQPSPSMAPTPVVPQTPSVFGNIPAPELASSGLEDVTFANENPVNSVTSGVARGGAFSPQKPEQNKTDTVITGGPFSTDGGGSSSGGDGGSGTGDSLLDNPGNPHRRDTDGGGSGTDTTTTTGGRSFKPNPKGPSGDKPTTTGGNTGGPRGKKDDTGPTGPTRGGGTSFMTTKPVTIPKKTSPKEEEKKKK